VISPATWTAAVEGLRAPRAVAREPQRPVWGLQAARLHWSLPLRWQWTAGL